MNPSTRKLITACCAAALFLAPAAVPAASDEIEGLMASAEAAREEQDWAAAAGFYRQVIDLDMGHAGAHRSYQFNSSLAVDDTVDQELDEEEREEALDAAYKANKEKMLALYEGWAEQYPDSGTVTWALGQLYSYKDWDKVEAYTKRAIELDPKLSEAYQTLALISDVRGDNAMQEKYLAKAVEASPDDPSFAFYHAMSFRRGDRSRYEPAALAMIERFPGEERAAQALFWLAEESSDPGKKIAYLERLRKEFPPAEYSWSSSGMGKLVDLYTRSDPAQALEIARAELAAADPEKYDGWPVRHWTEKVGFLEALIEANGLMDKGDYAAAAGRMEAVEAPKRGRADVLHTTRARALDGAGRTDEAYDYLAPIAARNPTDAVSEAAFRYGAKLGKNPQQVTAELQAALTAKAEPLEDFSFERYDTGETVSLSDYRGKVVLMNFWYPFCGPCRGENPYLQKILEKYADDFVILALNVHPEEDAFVMPYTRGNGFDFIPLKSDMEFAKNEFQARGMPTNILLDTRGNRLMRLPSIHGDEVRTLELQIETLMAKPAGEAEAP